MPCKPMD